jgi:hypothetical protein
LHNEDGLEIRGTSFLILRLYEKRSPLQDGSTQTRLRDAESFKAEVQKNKEKSEGAVFLFCAMAHVV